MSLDLPDWIGDELRQINSIWIHRDGSRWRFIGMLISDDDFYYCMWPETEDKMPRLLSGVGNMDVCGYVKE